MRPVLPVACALLLLGLPRVLAAQAPVIGPDGDPSVRNDSIYALAGTQADYPGEDAIFLLDDGVVTIHADGRRTRTYRQVIQVLHEDGLQAVRERSFAWSPGRETFRLNWIRIVAPDGRVISEGPAQAQESDVPARFGDPVYSDQRVLRVSLAGGAVGTIVDFSYTRVEQPPEVPGDYLASWSVTTASSTLRSRYIVEAPDTLALRIEETNLPFEPVVRRHGGRTTRTWATRNLPYIRGQLFSADSNDVYQSIRTGGPVGWEAIGRWYAGLAEDRYAVPAEVAAAASAVVAGSRTLADTVGALHKWVAQDIRYVSIALGRGGYQPRPPAEVVATGFGDCKDKATLFVAVLRSWGVPASTVLLSSGGGADSSLPSVQQFDHAIAAVDLPGGRRFTDLTVGLLPFGTLPLAEQGSFGLLVRPDGTTEAVTFPRAPLTDHEMHTVMDGAIDTEGRFAGWLTIHARGLAEWDLRSTLSTPYDSTERATFAREVAAGAFAGARGDSLELFDGNDLGHPAQIRLFLSQGRALQRSGGAWVLPHPLGTSAGVATIADRLESEGKRVFPIDVRGLQGEQREVEEFIVRLPAGWRPHLPPDVEVDGPFGHYVTTYAFADGRLHIRRVRTGARGVLPPERVGDLMDWLRGIADDDAQFLLIEAGSPAQ